MWQLQNEVTKRSLKNRHVVNLRALLQNCSPISAGFLELSVNCFLCTAEINQADQAARTAPNYTLKCRKQSKQSEKLWGGVKSSQKNQCDESDGWAAVLIHAKQTRGERNSCRQVAVSPVTRNARASLVIWRYLYRRSWTWTGYLW